MKEIGDIFREKREEIGISIDEVSSDLNIDKVLIENLENGNEKVFKDIIEIQDIIVLYQKYLDLEDINILDKYNDYLFEKTSKISISDIKERLSETEDVKEEKKVKSPYTVFDENKYSKENKKVIFLVILLFLLVILYVVLKKVIVG